MISLHAVEHLIPTADDFRRAITALVVRTTDGNRAQFCRTIGLPVRALNGWLTKGERPSMSQLLELCYRSRIDPADIAGALDSFEGIMQFRDDVTRLRHRASCWRLSVLQRREIQLLLMNFLSDADCPPLSWVARQIGLPVRCLRYWFPVLCKEMSIRHFVAMKVNSQAYQTIQAARVGEVVRQLKSEGIYPSRRQVSNVLRKEGMSLAQAHLLQAYRDAL